MIYVYQQKSFRWSPIGILGSMILTTLNIWSKACIQIHERNKWNFLPIQKTDFLYATEEDEDEYHPSEEEGEEYDLDSKPNAEDDAIDLFDKPETIWGSLGSSLIAKPWTTLSSR